MSVPNQDYRQDKKNIAIQFSVFTFKLAMIGERTLSRRTEIPHVLGRIFQSGNFWYMAPWNLVDIHLCTASVSEYSPRYQYASIRLHHTTFALFKYLGTFLDSAVSVGPSTGQSDKNVIPLSWSRRTMRKTHSVSQNKVSVTLYPDAAALSSFG
jgi:hypothetical protein